MRGGEGKSRRGTGFTAPSRPALLGSFGVFALAAAAKTADDQKAKAQRIEDALLAPWCYAEPVSRHRSEIAVKMRLEIA